MTDQLNPGEIERMRAILKDYDQKQAPLRTIDLNNPPKEPYTHQRFPKMVYDLESSKPGHIVSLVVRDEDELETALGAGYSKQAPSYGNAPEETLSPALQAEANTVQEQIEAKKRERKTA